MSRPVRFEVLPDVAGHWSVTRDRVVDAEFDDRDAAVAYAEDCVARVRRAGGAVRLLAHPALPSDAP